MIDQAIAALDRFIEAGMRDKKRRALDPIEKKLQDEMAGSFKQQGSHFLDTHPPIGELAPAGDVVSWQVNWTRTAIATTARMVKAIHSAASSSLQAGADDAIEQVPQSIDFGVSFDLENPRAVDYLRDRAAEQVAGINDTTRGQLQTIIADGVEQGQTYSEVAATIRETFDGFGGSRAQTIAVTEAASGYVAGSLAAAADMADAGLTMEKSWLKEEDACDEVCIPNADQGYIAYDETFESGDDGPPAHPNCRCDLLIRRVGSG